MRLKEILKSKSGVSIIYVLAVMSLFLALSIAVLSATLAANATVEDTANDNQVRTIAMSVSETFLSALNNQDAASTLSEDLIDYLYVEQNETGLGVPIEDLVLDVNFDDSNIEIPKGYEITSTTLGFTVPGTNTSSIQIFIGQSEPRQDRMEVMMTLTTEITYEGEAVSYVSTYQCGDIVYEPNDIDGSMEVTNIGTWEQTAFKKVDVEE